MNSEKERKARRLMEFIRHYSHLAKEFGPQIVLWRIEDPKFPERKIEYSLNERGMFLDGRHDYYEIGKGFYAQGRKLVVTDYRKLMEIIYVSMGSEESFLYYADAKYISPEMAVEKYEHIEEEIEKFLDMLKSRGISPRPGHN